MRRSSRSFLSRRQSGVSCLRDEALSPCSLGPELVPEQSSGSVFSHLLIYLSNLSNFLSHPLTCRSDRAWPLKLGVGHNSLYTPRAQPLSVP